MTQTPSFHFTVLNSTCWLLQSVERPGEALLVMECLVWMDPDSPIWLNQQMAAESIQASAVKNLRTASKSWLFGGWGPSISSGQNL